MYLINIYPLGNLENEYHQNMHMFLTHMVEKYPAYVSVAQSVPGYKILDNSLIELGGSVSIQRVVNAARLIEADEIILPDVFQNGPETLKAVDKALEELDKIYPNGQYPFKLQAVAQGATIEEWYQCYTGLQRNPMVDVIGIPKILAKMHPQGRPYFVNELCSLGTKEHHLLGMWYSMSEIGEYTRPDLIRSCDTVLWGFINKYALGLLGVRPDGYTINLEKDVIKYDDMDSARLLKGVEFGI